MLGKKAALAAPMSALAARRVCSACSTSGRDSRMSELIPAGTSAREFMIASSSPDGVRSSATTSPTRRSSAFLAWAAETA